MTDGGDDRVGCLPSPHAEALAAEHGARALVHLLDCCEQLDPALAHAALALLLARVTLHPLRPARCARPVRLARAREE
jgi:hypothetical protein